MATTPTPAEIAKRFLPPLPGTLGDVQAGKLIDGLSEHYHLLPKVEPYPDDTVHPYWVATDVSGPQVVKVTDSDDSCDENWVGIEFSARWRTVDVETAQRLASMFASAAEVAKANRPAARDT